MYVADGDALFPSSAARVDTAVWVAASSVSTAASAVVTRTGRRRPVVVRECLSAIVRFPCHLGASNM